MAKSVISAEIKVESKQAEQSLGSIKTRLKEAKDELTNAIEEFGEFSKEAANAAKKVEGLKGTIDDAGRLVSAFDGDRKFQAFGNAVGAVASGFAAAQGAMALLGVESKQIEQSLLKVQAAMALSQGINGVLEGVKAFKDLSLVIKSSAAFQKAYALATTLAAATQKLFTGAVASTSIGFKALRTAIISTGIGALVVGIGLLVEKIIEWTSSTDDQIDSQEALKNATEDLNSALSSQYSQIDRLTKIESQRAKISGATADEVEKIDERATSRKIAHIDGLIKLAKKYNVSTAALDAERIKLNEKQEDEQIENQLKRADRSRALAKAAEEKAKADAEKAKKAAEDEAERQKKIKEFGRELNLDLRRDIEANIEADREAYKAQVEASTAAEKELAEARTTISNEYFDRLSAKRNQDAEEQKRKDQEKIDSIAAVSNALSVASDIIGKQTAVGKALAIATALINTYQGATEVLRAKSVLPEPFGTISKIANVAAIIATGIKSIKAITSVKVPGNGGGGASVSAPSITAPVAPTAATTTLNQGQINQIGNAAVRAFVVESDVSGQQERIRRINRAARVN